tara:strand:- start:48 stop:419 length:372 start_codon:yes stop_codon:yes gene_type:complete
MPTPAHKPTTEQRTIVKAMASYGIPHADIAPVVGIERKALERHYSEELATATAEANTKVATRLFDRAMEGDVKAMMFWLERRGGDAWKHKPVVQLVPGDFTIEMNPANFLELPSVSDYDDDQD